jgi:hypothetical protein
MATPLKVVVAKNEEKKTFSSVAVNLKFSVLRYLNWKQG